VRISRSIGVLRRVRLLHGFGQRKGQDPLV
jgi:hypothetical protein